MPIDPRNPDALFQALADLNTELARVYRSRPDVADSHEEAREVTHRYFEKSGRTDEQKAAAKFARSTGAAEVLGGWL